MKILLTVPHCVRKDGGFCTSRDNCDSKAIAMANVLQQTLPWPTTVILGSVNRLELDLNRIESRNHTFRNQIRNQITADTLVIDVHSFPEEETWGRGTWQQAIVLLDKDPYNVMQNVNLFNIGPVLEGVNNDIMDECLQSGTRCFLLEVNESSSMEQLRQIAIRVKNFLQ